MSEKKLDFGQNNCAGVVIAAFGVSRGIFWAVLFGKTMIFDWFPYFERKCSGLCQKFTAGFPKLQSTCLEKNFERGKKLKNCWFFSNFVFWVKKIGLWANQFRRVRQSCIRRVQRNLLSIFHWKNDDFWMKFVLWAKKFRTLPKFYCSFPKLQSTCQEKNCERRKSWKIDDYLVILKLWVKKLDSEQNNWVGVVKTTFGVSRGILWQFFIEKRMVFDRFSHFERKSSGPCQTFTAGFSKLQSTCPEKNIESGKIWEIDDFVIILYFELKKMDFGQNNSAGVVIAAFGVFRGNFWAVLFGKTMIFDWFSYFERKCSGLCQKLTAGCLKLQSTCPEKILREKKWKNDDFSVILYSELEKWTLGKTVWHGLSKLHSACPEESFEHFSLEKRWLLKDFRTLSKKVPDFAKNQRQGFRNFKLRVRRKFLREKNFEKMMIS